MLSFGAMARGISPARAARLREPLERLYRRYDYDARIASDAIQYPARYADPLDREIVGLLSACLAYGRVSLFGAWLVRLLEWLGPSPRGFVAGFDPARDAQRFAPFHYRFTRGTDVAAAVLAIHRLIARHGSLRAAFVAGYSADEPDVRPALHRFAASILEQDFRTRGHAAAHARIPSPLPGSGHGAARASGGTCSSGGWSAAIRRTSETGARSRPRSS